jgi:N-acetylmuramoyl-L-alanine amidase
VSHKRKMAASADADCLAKNIYYEAGAESTDGKIAVAMVTRNRMKSGLFPKTACGVVYQPQQFSWVRDSNLAQIVTNSTTWKESRRIAIAVLAKGKSMADNTRGSLYFHNSTVKPAWATHDRFTTQIDGHFFYR